jgi:hypothetical protein
MGNLTAREEHRLKLYRELQTKPANAACGICGEPCVSVIPHPAWEGPWDACCLDCYEENLYTFADHREIL